jgi:hypothetical protein
MSKRSSLVVVYLRLPVGKCSVLEHEIALPPRLDLAAELGQVAGLFKSLLGALPRAVEGAGSRRGESKGGAVHGVEVGRAVVRWAGGCVGGDGVVG